MIILEGPDQIGKTTAAMRLRQMIAEYTRRPETDCYRHMSKPDLNFDHFESYIAGLGSHVQDRFHLGAIVYGLLLGRGSYPSSQHMLIVQRMLRWRGALTIIMHGEQQWMRENLKSRAEMYNAEQILVSNQAFAMLAGSTNCGESYCQIAYNVSRCGYPSEETLRFWFETWKKTCIP